MHVVHTAHRSDLPGNGPYAGQVHPLLDPILGDLFPQLDGWERRGGRAGDESCESMIGITMQGRLPGSQGYQDPRIPGKAPREPVRLGGASGWASGEGREGAQVEWVRWRIFASSENIISPLTK